MQGLGAAISATVAKTLIVWAGYTVTFPKLTSIAGMGFGLYLLVMPETKR